MKKYLVLPFSCLFLVGCLASQGIEDELTTLSEMREQRLEAVDQALQTGEITPSEWVAARQEIYDEDREAREDAAGRRSVIAGEEIRSYLDLLLYALFGAGGLAGVQMARRVTGKRSASSSGNSLT